MNLLEGVEDLRLETVLPDRMGKCLNFEPCKAPGSNTIDRQGILSLPFVSEAHTDLMANSSYIDLVDDVDKNECLYIGSATGTEGFVQRLEKYHYACVSKSLDNVLVHKRALRYVSSDSASGSGRARIHRRFKSVPANCLGIKRMSLNNLTWRA